MITRQSLFNILNHFLWMTLAINAVPAEDKAKSSTSVDSASTTSTAASPEDVWDSFGSDVELEVRVILGGTGGISGSFPRELNDMRTLLNERFTNCRTFKPINTIWLSSWPGEKAVSLVFPDHVLTAEIAAVNPQGGQAKVTVSLERDRGGIGGKQQNYLRAGDVAIGQTQKNPPSGELLELLRSSMTVGPKHWQVIGGIQVHVTPDGKEIATGSRDRNLLSTTIVDTSRDDSTQIRYLIIGLRTRERIATQTTPTTAQ